MTDTKRSNNELDIQERILSTARIQLETLGVDGTTIRSIAKESNVSPTTLYNRFGGKDNIISMVVIKNFDSQVDTKFNIKNNRIKPINKLLTLVELEQQAMLEKPKLAFALAEMYFKQNNDRQLPNLLLKMLRERILPILEQMQEENSIQGWVKLNVLSDDIADRILSNVVKYGRKEILADELKHHMNRSILSTLAGFATNSQSNVIQSKLKSATTKCSDFVY